MSKGIFVDKSHEPTENEVFKAISSTKPLWDNLISFIENNYKIKGEFKFYGKNFGWALRYRKSGRVLISIYPGKDEFTGQIILNENQVKEALKSDLSQKTREMIENTAPIREGRWLYLKIASNTDIYDIKKLISVRSSIK